MATNEITVSSLEAGALALGLVCLGYALIVIRKFRSEVADAHIRSVMRSFAFSLWIVALAMVTSLAILALRGFAPHSHPFLLISPLTGLMGLTGALLGTRASRKLLTSQDQLRRALDNAQIRRSESEELLQRLFETSPFMMGVVEVRDNDVFHVTHNTSVARFIGIEGQDLRGRGSTAVGVPAEETRSWIEKYLRSAKENKPVSFDYKNARFGEPRDMNATLVYLGDSLEGHQRFSYVIADITERRSAERSLVEHRARMVSASRLSELGELSGNIAHEINNPLSIILSKASQLKESVEAGRLNADELTRGLTRIEVTVERISGIVRSIKTLARDGSRDPIQKISVESLLHDALELCREKARLCSAEVSIDHESADLELECRPTQISQVLINIFNNALDAVCDSEQRQIHVRAREVSDLVEITVSDSGPGIGLEDRARIFEPFFTTKAFGQGTGLGLSLARDTVESHAGRLFLDPHSKQTRFVILLPKKQARASLGLLDQP